MNKRAFFVFTTTASILSLGLIVTYLGSAALRAAAQQTAQTKQAARAASSVPILPATTGAPAVADAANAFLAALSESQRTTAQIELTPSLAARWSNFPAAVVPRNGVFFRDLDAKQTAAALKVARLALSESGFNRFQEVRAADDAFAKSDDARRGPGGGGPGGRGRGGFGGPPSDGQGGSPSGGVGGQGGPPSSRFGGPGGQGGPQNLFGAGNYIIAFLGKPSKTTPWLLQLGGHHIAFNLYYKGKAGAATPYFVGVQPNTWNDANGKTHAPLAPMRDAMHDLTHSLTPEQLTQARLESRFSDVYVGPGRDGQFPARSEGIPASSLSTASRNKIKQAIDAWTGDSVQGAEYRKRYYAELNATKVAYSGSTALNQEGDYVRIDGPHVWIEFACQGSDHYHTIWRDKSTDYGAEFSF